MKELEQVLQSIKATADETGTQIITGDTKVVSHGQADKLFINTAGIGIVPDDINVSGAGARIGDKIILSGTIGDHGIAIMSLREGLKFSVPVESDCQPLNKLVQQMLEISPTIRCLRDPTRGGLATTLNEIATQSQKGVFINEAVVPVKEAVRAACELLGLDPLYIANEGKLVAVVESSEADKILASMKRSPYGKDAAIIGEIIAEHTGKTIMKTRLGSSRMLDMLSGDLLPRIC
jgi:hydrogenase expression/formation protein HypE